MMLASKRQTKGLTLIELMIVMVIMSLLLSLVGGLGVKSVERAQARTEVMQLQNWCKRLTQVAFNSGQTLYVNFEGHTASVSSIDPRTVDLESHSASIDAAEHTNTPQTLDSKLVFKYLFFQPQRVLFNSNGFPNTNSLTFQLRDQSIEVNLLPQGPSHVSGKS